MSFGWSANDIVAFTRLCYEIYSFCERAPAELQTLSDRLDVLGRKLIRLSYILEQSGLERWQAVSSLEKDLLDAKTYLEPLRSDANNATSISSRAKGLGKYALKQDKIRSMERSLAQREREIDDMKIDIILVCSLRNLRYDQGQIRQDPTFGSTQANINIGTILANDPHHVALLPSIPLDADSNGLPSRSVSNASRVLATAVSLRSRHSMALELPNDNDSLADRSAHGLQVAEEFVTEIASIAEQQELFSQKVDHSQNLELFAGMTDTVMHFDLARSPSQNSSNTNSMSTQLPQVSDPDLATFVQATFDHLSSASDSASLRLWASKQNQRSSSGLLGTSNPDSVNLPRGSSEFTHHSRPKVQDSAQVEDEILPTRTTLAPTSTSSQNSNTGQGERVKLQGWSRVSLDANVRTAVLYSYEIEVLPGSVAIVCVPIEHDQNTKIAPGVRAISDPSVTRPSKVIRHHLRPMNPSIPHLLYPEVEGPVGNPDDPYTLSFTEPQRVSIEGSPEDMHGTTSLHYTFEKQMDRTSLCEKIFGKTLVMTCSSDKISLASREVSHVSAISLWFDEAHRTLSITFLNNVGNSKAFPKDEEWIVNGLSSKGKATRNQASLVLAVSARCVPGAGVVPLDTGTGIFSTTPKNVPLRKKFFRSSPSPGAPTASECVIQFTHSKDRDVFAEYIQR